MGKVPPGGGYNRVALASRLKYNFITDRGLERLSKMSTLQLVDVSGNKQVTAGGIAKLSRSGEVEVLVSERESFSLEGD